MRPMAVSHSAEWLTRVYHSAKWQMFVCQLIE
jgi:hypothetical protein